MQGCWPSKCFQLCGSWRIQMCWEHISGKNKQANKNKISQRIFASSDAELALTDMSQTLLQPYRCNEHWITRSQTSQGWCCHGNCCSGSGLGGTQIVPGVLVVPEGGGRGIFRKSGGKGKKKCLTAPTNRVWSGMWRYAVALFSKHLRNAWRTFFMLSGRNLIPLFTERSLALNGISSCWHDYCLVN